MCVISSPYLSLNPIRTQPRVINQSHNCHATEPARCLYVFANVIKMEIDFQVLRSSTDIQPWTENLRYRRRQREEELMRGIDLLAIMHSDLKSYFIRHPLHWGRKSYILTVVACWSNLPLLTFPISFITWSPTHSDLIPGSFTFGLLLPLAMREFHQIFRPRCQSSSRLPHTQH